MKKICFSLIGVTLLSTPAATQVVEEIITRVNNQIVTRSEFLRSKDQLKEEVKQQDAANADKVYGQREKDILRDLIDQQLLLEKGKDLGITGDTELIKRLNQIITQKVIGEEVGSHLTITKEEQQKFYDEHKSEMEQPEAIQLSEILVAPAKPPAAENKPTADKDTPDNAGSAGGTPAPAAAAGNHDEAAALVAAQAKANDVLEQIRK